MFPPLQRKCGIYFRLWLPYYAGKQLKYIFCCAFMSIIYIFLFYIFLLHFYTFSVRPFNDLSFMFAQVWAERAYTYVFIVKITYFYERIFHATSCAFNCTNSQPKRSNCCRRIFMFVAAELHTKDSNFFFKFLVIKYMK